MMSDSIMLQRVAAVLCWLTCLAFALPQDDAVRMGPGVTAPKPIFKPEPTFTDEARDACVQGTVVIEVIIDEQGRIVHQSVLSPLGFGLDESAQEAIANWTFQPARKDSKPVKMLATIEVNFRLSGAQFDAKAERRRTSFNLAVRGLQQNDAKQKERAVKTMEDLARQNFPPGMYAWGKMLVVGEPVPQDVDRGLAMITRAAHKNYGPALYEVGRMYLDGNQMPRDSEKGLQMIRNAATLGSKQAPYYLGEAYDNGAENIPRDAERARRYFRLCAAAGEGSCQWRLGRLLLDEPNRPDRDYVQAIAWLQLAADHDMKEAAAILGTELPKLSRDQIKWSYKLKDQLVRKQ